MKQFNKNIILTVAGTIAVVLAVVFALLIREIKARPEKIELVRLGTTNLETAIPFYVAEDMGFFAQYRLDVKFRYYDTGLKSIDGMLPGNEIDIASAVAEFVFTGKALNKEKIQIIASFDKSDYEVLIGRRDRGIETVPELKKKKIGFIQGTIQEFYLGRFLEMHNMSIKDILPVYNASLSRIPGVILNGEADAVVSIPPYTGNVLEKLGPRAVLWNVQSSQLLQQLLVSKKDWIREHPALIERFLRAVKKAEEFIMNDPEKAGVIAKNKLNLSDNEISGILERNRFSLSLDQSLIAAMEDEARWMIKNHPDTGKEMPDFTDFIYTKGLKSVAPCAVNLIGH